MLGVVTPGPDGPRLAYLDEALAATPDVLALSSPAHPTQVFRLSGKCQEASCPQFSGGKCSLGTRVAQLLPAVVDKVPRCIIRSDCRWFHQEGAAACLRCPQIATVNFEPSALMRRVIAIAPQPQHP